MFETAELGRKIDKAAYLARLPELRRALVQREFQLRDARKGAIVVLSGDDRPSCNEVFNLLHEWLDPRQLEGNAFGVPTDAEVSRPFFWRYWMTLPANGTIGMFLRGWTMQPVVMRMTGAIDDDTFEQMLGHVRVFEQELIDDGALLLKFWLHLSAGQFRRRLKDAKKDPEKYWRYGKHDPRLVKDYDRAIELMERAVRVTSTADSPWRIVESTDDRYRNLTVAETVLEGLVHQLETPASAEQSRPAVVSVEHETSLTVLDKVDLTRALSKDDYIDQLRECQSELFELTRDRAVTTVLAFEGWDAAGKGGIIRRLTHAMDAALYRVVPIAAPTEEEQAHHYLWRFWRHLPRVGHVTVFDRSWYGRVLVERVEELASVAEWQRAYSEINDFEEQLVDHGIVLLKFWLQIDADEQLRRFKARERTPYKRYKITPEDYRNREHWNDYELAVNEMIGRTSTPRARWNLIAANDKRWARISVLKTVRDAVKHAIKRTRKKS